VDVTIFVTVYPEEGQSPRIARGLLAAADHPNQVRSVSHPRAGFEVPQEVFDRFVAEQESEETEEPEKEETPKRRGRPRKAAEPVTTSQEGEND
jgi:hypothetical protein